MQQKYLVSVAIILGAAIIGFFIYLGIAYGQGKPNVTKTPVASSVACGAANDTVVTKVVDGDTVVVQGGWHVRILGIDADEKNYPCYDAAKKRLEELVLNKEVRLEKDTTDTDQYQRCLRNVFVGGNNIGLQLVGEGLAVARFYPPDVKYRSEVSSAEQQAIAAKTGCKWVNQK